MNKQKLLFVGLFVLYLSGTGICQAKKGTAISERILGFWVAKGFNKPTLEIKKSTIRYFVDPGEVPYHVIKDSIYIRLSKQVEQHPVYLITIKGNDTLILTSNRGYKSVLYRYRNK